MTVNLTSTCALIRHDSDTRLVSRSKPLYHWLHYLASQGEDPQEGVESDVRVIRVTQDNWEAGGSVESEAPTILLPGELQRVGRYIICLDDDTSIAALASEAKGWMATKDSGIIIAMLPTSEECSKRSPKTKDWYIVQSHGLQSSQSPACASCIHGSKGLLGTCDLSLHEPRMKAKRVPGKLEVVYVAT